MSHEHCFEVFIVGYRHENRHGLSIASDHHRPLRAGLQICAEAAP